MLVPAAMRAAADAGGKPTFTITVSPGRAQNARWLKGVMHFEVEAPKWPPSGAARPKKAETSGNA